MNLTIMKRSRALAGLAAAAVALAGGKWLRAAAAQTQYEVVHTEAEWRKLLTPEQFYVLRQHGTEYAFSSPLDKERRPGTYLCAGCRLPLYDSSTKYDSGTGWPSFFRPLPNAIATSQDYSLVIAQTEVHCRRCGGHLGHVYDDGPKPTGLRYCMDGVALIFIPRS